jgi:catechol 2,3-dioxygenase-like lactoylglutathione lyase family enzyme
MLDHISVGVRDMKAARAFYGAVLAPLGMTEVMPVDVPGQGLVAVGYGGADGHPVFWIGLPFNGRPANDGNGTHIAFKAENREAVDAFYLAAIKAGGSDEGTPGHRTDYSPDYYGAFARDLDGHKIEAVCHTLE